MEFQPRPKQQAVLDYVSGKMGVSAVPGSGKTQVLSYLAAQLVARGGVAEDQEVLVVTLVNSAVDNFAARVAGFMGKRGLLPHVGYRVRTLHAVAHEIVRERPSLVGLADDFQIVAEHEASNILRSATAAWLAGHPSAADDYLSPDLDDGRRDFYRRDPASWPALVAEIAGGFVKKAKDLGHTPAGLRDSLDKHPEPLPLLEMGLAIYLDYERALAYRGAVDFDDLIRLALRALELDSDYLARLRHRWPYILEDEAQDSSRLQEKILRLLAGPAGNWVRVGDPNQAIYETFTTASPLFLRNFLVEPKVVPRDLPNSGRSTQSIIDLANRLVDWTQHEHPLEAVRGALVAPPQIQPTPPGDPQPNPEDDPLGIRFYPRGFPPADEVTEVADSLERWLPDHPDWTVAVLAPRNDRGAALVTELRRRKIETVELLKSTSATRAVADALGSIVAYLADAVSLPKLLKVFREWRRADRDDAAAWLRMQRMLKALGQCPNVEDFLWPRVDRDWLTGIDLPDDDPAAAERLLAFRDLVRRWQGTAALPIDQIILTLAQDLFDRPADLALAHKFATTLRSSARAHPEWRLKELKDELALVALNERKFLDFGEGETGFDPQQHKGKVVVATLHKAKGLEWDRVHLMSVNSYDFPAALAGDTFQSEKNFVRGSLNLPAEMLAQLKALFEEDILAPYAEEGAATRQARLDYAAERLRLLYVGITRARRELIITWNTGKGYRSQQEAAALTALRTWWEEARIRLAAQSDKVQSADTGTATE
jgi:DNA helicase-2/ATP-dependent DNA helicase PcrA